MRHRDFTDKMHWKMCDANMSSPVPLAEADLCKPFVYDRRFGVFYVPMGHHQSAMSLILAWHHDCDDGIDVSEKLGLEYSSGTADHWLEHTVGAAFRSSVGKLIQIANFKNLTIQERRLFAGASCVFPNSPVTDHGR